VLCCVNLTESKVRVVWVYGDFSPTLCMYVCVCVCVYIYIYRMFQYLCHKLFLGIPHPK